MASANTVIKTTKFSQIRIIMSIIMLQLISLSREQLIHQLFYLVKSRRSKLTQRSRQLLRPRIRRRVRLLTQL